jgi:UDP-glucose 4-epimerase
MKQKGKVLVTGGCGYIGSHTIVDLIGRGFEVICVDSLINASDEVLDGIFQITGKEIRNCHTDVSDWACFKKVFEDEPDILAIIHFAALKSVEESVFHPEAYYNNNVVGINNVIRAVHEFSVPHVIFSSSCTVYGNAEKLPVTETTPIKEAESPYGATKQIAEIMLSNYYQHVEGGSCISLRYFNPAGAHESSLIGESPTTKASNLVPVITETAIGKRDQMTVFGGDYDTRDGTCVRDYIHVMDLAAAHSKALSYLIEGKNQDRYEVFNLGIGEGVTVLEAIQAFEKVSQQSLNYQIGPRRAGDVVAMYANKEKSEHFLDWRPARGIEEIMDTAWKWEKARSGKMKEV